MGSNQCLFLTAVMRTFEGVGLVKFSMNKLISYSESSFRLGKVHSLQNQITFKNMLKAIEVVKCS